MRRKYDKFKNSPIFINLHLRMNFVILQEVLHAQSINILKQMAVIVKNVGKYQVNLMLFLEH